MHTGGGDMSVWPGYLRLCRLLDDTLRPFSDFAAAKSLTEELEQDLLIPLSEVLCKVREWTHKLDSDEELLAEPADKTEHSVAAAICCLDNRQCLVKIISDLISLLVVVDSIHVQHLVGNVLVAISGFVVASERGWDDLMQFLCLCLEWAICNTLSSIEPNALETRYSCYDSVSKSFLNQNLKCANWSEIAAIVRVLRGILKYIKQDIEEKIIKVYLDSVNSLILNVPWDLLGEIHVDCNFENIRDVSLRINVVQPREINIFFGQFTQFLCSYVDLSSSLENGADFYPFTCKIISIVQILVPWFHSEPQNPLHVRIFHYCRHKIQMLMIKLISGVHIEDNIAKSWLHLLHKYFEDLLLQPLSEVQIDQSSPLEELPFCTSFTLPVEQNVSSRHLQRLTVFLFLRCSLHLLSVKKKSNDEGTIELYKWLRAHVPLEADTSHDLYFQQCVRFTSSFLQLFMHEDDILFEILLQLFSLPYPPQLQAIEGDSCSEVENDLLLASHLFNPINIFHLFLAEILYDHQVLLDYLISKDTGSRCAEYLLRSLRIICNSWDLFAEFPGLVEKSGQLRSKRRKVSTNNFGFKETSPFMAARNCLASLRASIDNLNQKNLFPYNPQVLLTRLMRFEELCIRE